MKMKKYLVEVEFKKPNDIFAYFMTAKTKQDARKRVQRKLTRQGHKRTNYKINYVVNEDTWY